MKNPWEWEEDDLLQLISLKIQKSLELDYKACGALNTKASKKDLLTEISKDVSAFANSAGGVIVYGVKEKDSIPTGLDEGFDSKETSREWLEQVINSRIQRRIDGVKIKQIELSGKRDGKVAYVVYVPQSLHAPHQAADKRFYKRFNFQSVPMEEYEVRDVSRRLTAPELDLTVILHGDGKIEQKKDELDTPCIELQGIIKNLSQGVSEYAIINIFIDDRLTVKATGGMSIIPTFMPFGHKLLNVTKLQKNWAIPTKMPIFQGTAYQITDDRKFIKLVFPRDKDLDGERYILCHQVQSPGMEPKTKLFTITIIRGVAEIEQVDSLQAYSSIKNLSFR